MPVIHTHVSVSTTPEQREALKAAYGKAITAVPGKSEGWLMCPFEDNMPIYFGGDDSRPAAYVEVNVFGRSVPGSAWEKLTEQTMAALSAHGLAPRTLLMVHPVPAKNASVFLVEARRNGGHALTVPPPLYIYDERGEYTDELMRYYRPEPPQDDRGSRQQ